jgi:hypothetical protein
MKHQITMETVATVPTRRGIYPDARPSRSTLPPRILPRKRNRDSLFSTLLIVAVGLAAAIALSGPIVQAFAR